MQIYMYMHTSRLAHMYVESHQGPQATLVPRHNKGQTSAEEGWPSQQKDAWNSPGPGLPGKAGTLRALVELARHSLSVPRQALPRMTRSPLFSGMDIVLVG